MSLQEIVESLRACGFLRDLSEEDLLRFAELARPIEFATDELILREGDIAKDVFVILSGSVAVEICTPGIGCRRIMTLSNGDLLSWSSVLDHARLTATVRAITRTTAVVVNGRQLLTLCEHDPAFGYAFMRRVAQAMGNRLTAARMQLLDVFGEQMPVAPKSE